MNIWDKLRELKTVIKKWYQQKGAGDSFKISNLEEDIDREEKCLLENRDNGSIRESLAKKKEKLWAVYREEERFWLQKSRLKWLQEGDRNTKFFHLTASSRRYGNYIDKLVVQGNSIDNPRDIREAITKFFDLHFNKTQAVQIQDWNCNLRSLKENSPDLLERPFSEKEVWSVISNSDGNKAPGPDGYNMHFF